MLDLSCIKTLTASDSAYLQRLLDQRGCAALQPRDGLQIASLLSVDLTWACQVRTYVEDGQQVLVFEGAIEYELQGRLGDGALIRIPTTTGYGVWVLNNKTPKDPMNLAIITQNALTLRSAHRQPCVYELRPPFDIEVQTNLDWLLHDETTHKHVDGDYTCCPSAQRMSLHFGSDGLRARVLTSLSPLVDPPKPATSPLDDSLFVFVTPPGDDEPTIPLASLYVDAA